MLYISIGVICGIMGYYLGRRVTYSKLNKFYKKLNPQPLIDKLINEEVSRRQNQRE